MKRLFLIDAYALIYRSYYAFIKNPRINSKGENTSAIFGFLNTLEELLRREKPSHMAVAFDPKGKTFRHEAYEAYKAQREETPEDIKWSIPFIKQLLAAYRIPIKEIDGYEADDVIGTMAKKAAEKGFEVYMMTPDKDYGQLVGEKTYMYKPTYGSSEFEVLGQKEICDKYGLQRPEQIIDLLSLMGDASDNIPGCPGIGKVWAQKLIAQFDNIDNLLENADQLKGSIKEKICANKETILFSRFLATIKTDVPMTFNEDSLKLMPRDEVQTMALFERLEFRTWKMKQSASNYYSTESINKTIHPSNESNETTRKGQVEIIAPPHVRFHQAEQDRPKQSIVEQQSLWNDENSVTEGQIVGINPTKTPSLFEYENLSDVNGLKFESYLLDNKEVIDQFSKKICAANFVCLTVHTDTQEAMTTQLRGISLSIEENEAYYLPYSSLEQSDSINQIIDLLKSDKILKIGHNLKFDIIVLRRYGIRIAGPLFDTMIAHYLLQPETNHNLSYLAEIYLGKKIREVENDTFEISLEKVCATLALKKELEKAIKQEELDYLLYQVELPLIYVLADMEHTGVEIDSVALKELSEKLNARLKVTEESIYSLAGEKFNINSSKQIGELLFDKLCIVEKAKKTKKTKQYSTSEEVLESLKDNHPIVEKLLEYRSLKKLLSTYIDALPLLVNNKTNRIHTSFNQAITATGRLSSSNPNLQNIPIRDELGRDIRRVFVAGKNHSFLSADYSQIELRIMAELSGDEQMIEAFNQDQDIHKATASNVFKVQLEEVTNDMRRKAKTANFGIIYGISSFGLAERMAVSRKEAKQLIEDYFEHYPKIKQFIDQSIEVARTNGYVETIFHRKRYLPTINSHNAVVRSYAERNAVNAPIQGSAADIIKLAMISIWKSIQERQLKSRMILQVHDELNFIVPNDELDTMKELVREKMEQVVQFHILLKAEIGSGSNWLEAH